MKLVAGLAVVGTFASAMEVAQLRGFSKAKLINLHKQHVVESHIFEGIGTE